MLLVAGALASELYVPTAPALFVRESPDASAPRIGRLVEASSFEVVAHHAGPGCADWGALSPRGYACLEHAVPTEAPPVNLPVALPYAPPEPADAEQVSSTGTWPAREPVSLVPFVYGRRWRQWPGRTWTDLAAWDAGAPPRGRLIGGRPSRFVARVETARGPVLVRPDGQVAPESEVWLYPVSRFRGRDALADPVPPGLTVAWGRGTDAIPLRAAADPSAEVVASLPPRAELVVRAGPTGWWELSDGLGPGAPAWVPAAALRVWVAPSRPDEVADDAVWVDVHLDASTLTVLRGDTPLWITLVSTGTPGRYRTPPGAYRVTDKSAWWDMSSRSGSSSPYHVEAVPWTMHFAPRYALHGAYWHDRFGHPVSHGCVNLAPLDADVVFRLVGPELPTGWHTVVASELDPGSVVRIRP